MEKPLYVFDICGTIFKSNTTFDFLTFLLVPKNKSYSCFDKLRKTFVWKVFNKISRTYFHVDVTRAIALRFLRGYSRQDLLTNATAFYDSYLMKHPNSSVLDKIREIQADDSCDLLIASATIDVVAEVIANRLHIKKWYSSELCYNKEGICQGKLSKDLLGKKKELVQEVKNRPIYSIFTDDFTDMPLLVEAKQKNIIICPKTYKKWKKVVKQMKWDVNFIES